MTATQLAALYPVVRNITDYLARAIDPKTGSRHQPAGRRRRLSVRSRRLATADALRLRHEHGRAHHAQRDGGRRLPAGRGDGPGARPARRRASSRRTARDPRCATRSATASPAPTACSSTACARDGTPSAHASQQANAFALAFGIVPAAQVEDGRRLRRRAGHADGRRELPRPARRVARSGRDDALVAALTDPDRPGYAQILKEGATFTWESWDARQTGDSESHGWGATVLAVLQDDVLGVRVDRAGRRARRRSRSRRPTLTGSRDRDRVDAARTDPDHVDPRTRVRTRDDRRHDPGERHRHRAPRRVRRRRRQRGRAERRRRSRRHRCRARRTATS